MSGHTYRSHYFYKDILAEYHLGSELFGPIAERLAFFWTINPIQPNLFTPTQAHDGYGVTIGDPYHFIGKFFGPEGEAKNRRRMIVEFVKTSILN